MTIEIGTSDYETNAGKNNGIYIEPVKYYFDRLPDNCIKENVAISDKEGSGYMYYITDEEIKKYNFEWYLRGCSTLNHVHGLITDGLRKYNLSDEEIINIVHKQEVKIVRIKSIIDKYNVTYIDLLKIDAETYDIPILNDFLNTTSLLPNTIIFEVNSGTDLKELNILSKRLRNLNYSMSWNQQNMSCILIK